MRSEYYWGHKLSYKEWLLEEDTRGHGNAQAPRDSGL